MHSRSPSLAQFWCCAVLPAQKGQSPTSSGQRPGNCQPPLRIGPIGRISQIGRIACSGWLMFRPLRGQLPEAQHQNLRVGLVCGRPSEGLQLRGFRSQPGFFAIRLNKILITSRYPGKAPRLHESGPGATPTFPIPPRWVILTGTRKETPEGIATVGVSRAVRLSAEF